MLVIEIDDKSSHINKYEYDRKRDEYLRGLGLIVIHISAEAVLKSPNDVFNFLINHPDCFAATPPQEGNLGQNPQE
jgi:very-short-patch-repair endonuclease